MKTVNLTCIGCPLGCQLEVMMDANGDIQLITGNTCPRGEKYARKEVTSPTRIVTSSVRVYGSRKGERMVSVKTASDVPKGKIMEVMRASRCPARCGSATCCSAISPEPGSTWLRPRTWTEDTVHVRRRRKLLCEGRFLRRLCGCFSERSRIADKFKLRRTHNGRNASAPAHISREQ